METISEKKVLNKYLQIVIYKCNIELLITTSFKEFMNLRGYLKGNHKFYIVDTMFFNANKPGVSTVAFIDASTGASTTAFTEVFTIYVFFSALRKWVTQFFKK